MIAAPDDETEDIQALRQLVLELGALSDAAIAALWSEYSSMQCAGWLSVDKNWADCFRGWALK